MIIFNMAPTGYRKPSEPSLPPAGARYQVSMLAKAQSCSNLRQNYANVSVPKNRLASLNRDKEETAKVDMGNFNVGAFNIYLYLGDPYYNYRIVYPKTLF